MACRQSILRAIHLEDPRTDQFLIKNTPFIDVMIRDLCKWFALTLESMCPTSTHTHTHAHTQNHNVNSTSKSKLNQKQITTRPDQINKLEKKNTNSSQHTNLRVKIPSSIQSSPINPITTSISTSISSAVAASQSSISALRNKSKNISNDNHHQIPEMNKMKEKMKDNNNKSVDREKNKERIVEDEKDAEKNTSFRSFSLSRVPQYLSSKSIPNIHNIPRQFSSNTMPFSASLNSTSPRTSPSAGPARGFKILDSTAQPLPLSLPLAGSGMSSSSSTNSTVKPFLSPPAPSTSSSSSSFLFASDPSMKTCPLGKY